MRRVPVWRRWPGEWMPEVQYTNGARAQAPCCADLPPARPRSMLQSRLAARRLQPLSPAALTLALESCRAGACLVHRAVSLRRRRMCMSQAAWQALPQLCRLVVLQGGECGAGRVEMCLPAEFDSEMAGVGTCRRIQARLLPYPNLQCACMPACMRYRITGMQQHVSLHALSVRGERAALYCA